MGLRDAHEKSEQSIKARKHELYAEEEQAAGPSKPFAAYLQETPPTPLSPLAKGILWAVAVLVGLLFLAAVFGLTGSHIPAPPPKAASVPETGPASRLS